MAGRVGFLSDFEMLKDCSYEELKRLNSFFIPRQLRASTVICREGEAGNSCYLLVRGTVLVYRELLGRGRISFAPLLPGSMFGQVALLEGLPRLATCEAMGPVTLLELKEQRFRQILLGEDHLSVVFQRALALTLTRQLRLADQRLSELEDRPDEGQLTHLMSLLDGTH